METGTLHQKLLAFLARFSPGENLGIMFSFPNSYADVHCVVWKQEACEGADK